MGDIRRWTTVTGAALLLLAGVWPLGLTGPVVADSDSTQTLREQAMRLAHENACRRAEAELAEGERFYLVLDPEERSLTLKLSGALLREVSLDSVEVGRPRRLLLERDTRTDVRGQLHRQGRLAPQRSPLRLSVEVPENVDEETPTIMLPPEPETAIRVPRRFFVRFEDGVALEFRTGDGGRSLGQRIADGFSTLVGRSELRLYLVLDSAAAEAFYRSVPREIDLLVR